MNYTYCERLMWVAIAPAAFRYLARQELGWDISALKQLSKQIYRQMVSRTPDIGSMMENPLRVCLTGGILWLSIYKAAEEKMSEKCFEGMVSASMRSPLVVTAFRGKAKTAFTLKAQYKRAATASLADADRNPFQWNAEVIFGRDAEEYTILYHQCGLCALGRQEGLPHLVPYLCALDTMSVDWMGGRLYRTKTLAAGGDCCDFYICKKGSRWDKERQGKKKKEDLMTLAEFRRTYPAATFTVSSGKLFTYRYYQNPQAKATLVLLTGGIGLSDLFYKHFARFARDFSVLTFDYQLQFGNNGEFADAVAELLRHLKEKVWLVGQSLGGVVAQVIASRHPEVVEGLVLSTTCSLSGNMSKAGYQDLMKIIESQRKFKKWLAFLPFPLIKRMMRWAVMKKKTDGFTAQEKAAVEELFGAMMELLTKPYEQHMIDFLCDAEHYFGMTRNDFAPWEGRVLLILSEDDTTFTPACREDLIALMPSPTVVTDLTGGHLALLVRLEQYADLVTKFILERTP